LLRAASSFPSSARGASVSSGAVRWALTPFGRAESLGTAFIPARVDVNGNIERLAARASAPGAGPNLFALIEAEVADGTAGGSSSCTKGLLWLKRFLEFTLRLVERLAKEPGVELREAASAAYSATLAPYHGYLTTALFTVVMHAVPARASFERALLARAVSTPPSDAGALAAQMQSFADRFSPVLARVHQFLSDAGLCASLQRPAPYKRTHTAFTVFCTEMTQRLFDAAPLILLFSYVGGLRFTLLTGELLAIVRATYVSCDSARTGYA